MRVSLAPAPLNVAPDIPGEALETSTALILSAARGGMTEDEDEDHFDEEESFEVALEPFPHQVGGHSALFLMDPDTVCKPLIAREMRFYEEMPDELRPFLPGYKGQIQVSSESNPNGSSQLVVRNAPQIARLSRFHSASLEQKNQIGQKNKNSQKNQNDQKNQKNLNDQKTQKNVLSRFRHGSGSSTGEDFIAEDFVDEDEAESDENSTTSEETPMAGTSISRKRLITVRRQPKRFVDESMLFGLESWSLKCQEKQLMKIKKDDPCLVDFLLLENVCVKFHRPCILDLKMGTRQHGDDAPKEKMDRQMEKCASTTSKKIGVRACGMKIDFAHSSIPTSAGSIRHGGPDKGYLFGLENLIRLLEELGACPPVAPPTPPSPPLTTP